MGLHVDLLLTTGEEECASTAAVVRTRKQYCWTFSFDRKDDDVVFYQYECAALSKVILDAGFDVGVGSYSCIAELDHLGCCGMNFGCGMKDYHSDNAYCDLVMLRRQLDRFSDFYQKYANLIFPHAVPFETRSRASLRPWAVPAESLFWQFEYHRARGATDAAFRCQIDLARLLNLAPELRKEFAVELAACPELAEDPVARG
jgi:hypothetical protein